ncbi:MAG: HDIG domain-containing metalloprotein [Bacillota bacterium]
MTRDEALKLLKANLANKNLLKHCYACEVVMKYLAAHFGEDQNKWALAGLLHDIDYDNTKDDLSQHSLLGAKMLEEAGLPTDVVQAVKVHNGAHGIPRVSLMDKCLYSTDPVTGLIVAGALIKPEKKLSAIDVEFLIKRYHEKSFARGANRETIAACSEFGMNLEEFFGISLEAMQSISKELGL